MTTEDLKVRVAFWPKEAEKVDKDKGRVSFVPQIVTIGRIFDGERGVGWKFNEDPDGNIWNGRGQWNKEKRKTDKYEGPKFAVGNKVLATLQRTKGDTKDFFDVLDIRLAPEELQEPSAAEQAAYVDHQNGSAPSVSLPEQFDRHGNAMRDPNGNATAAYWVFNDEQRRLGMCFNNLTVRLAAIDQMALNFHIEKDGEAQITPFDKPDWYESQNAQWWTWFDEASRGLPLTPAWEAPAPQSGAANDAAEIAEQANAHLGDQPLPPDHGTTRTVTDPQTGEVLEEEEQPW